MPHSPHSPRSSFQVAQGPGRPTPIPSVSAATTDKPTPSASPTPVPSENSPAAIIVAPTPGESSPTPSSSPFVAPALTQTSRILVPTQTITTEIGDLPVIRDLPFKGLFLRGVELFLLIGLYMVLRHFTKRVIRDTTNALARREEEAGNLGRAVRLRTLANLTTSLTLYTLTFIFGVSLLSTVGINVTAIIGTAGVAGLAFGFGAQKLVKDMITGFFILLEDQYVVGDYVAIGSVTGTVESLEMRITRIRDDDGKLYILSNGDIAQVCNMSRGPVMGSFEIGISANSDLGKAIEALQTGLTSAGETAGLPEPPKVDGVSAVEATKTTLRITFKAPPGHRPTSYALRLREAARDALVKAGVSLG